MMPSIATSLVRYGPLSFQTQRPKQIQRFLGASTCIMIPIIAYYYFWVSRKPYGLNLVETRMRASPHWPLRRGSVTTADDETVEYLWQSSPPIATASRKEAILFLAHGCGHSMRDWWPADNSACKECIGLPEERAIVQIALELNFLVVAASSKGRCWSNADGPRVARVLQEVNRSLGLRIYAFGASSGGNFVSTVLGNVLAQSDAKLSGYVSQIAATLPQNPAWNKDTSVVFITMNRDLRTEEKAVAALELLRSEGVPARHIRLPPLQIAPDFFAQRIGVQYTERSKQMVGLMKEKGMLKDGYLTEDPRSSEWRSLLGQFALEDSMVNDLSPLSEVLNVAWGMHEMSRDGVQMALTFLLSPSQ